MKLNIEGKTAVITGADSGIGFETARILAGEGVNIVVSDIDQEELEEAAAKLKEEFPQVKITALAADLTSAEKVNELSKSVEDLFGGADILVNTAGARGAAGDFLELSDEDWQKTIEVDLMASVRMCRAFIPQMQKKKWGRIVLIASENALQPYEEESPYNACKAGLINLGKCLSKAYGKDGIMINTVSPAYIETPMTNAMMEEESEQQGKPVEEVVKWFLKTKRPGIVEQRRGQPKEVAAVISFLCSELASFVTGSNYRVDGGSVYTAFG